MTVSSMNGEIETDEYRILRHLFAEATTSSVGDKRWSFYGSHTNPDEVVFTEYSHDISGDRISCRSSDYSGGVYRQHIFTFKREADQ